MYITIQALIDKLEDIKKRVGDINVAVVDYHSDYHDTMLTTNNIESEISLSGNHGYQQKMSEIYGVKVAPDSQNIKYILIGGGSY